MLCLKEKVEIELIEYISDADIYLFLEKYMRGGFSYISKRYNKASNRYLKSYKSKKESKHIIYLDANNLYGYTMSKFILRTGFRGIHPKNFDSIKYSSNSSKRCALELGLKYPKELRQLHNDYTLASCKIKIKKWMLSKYHWITSDSYNIPIGNPIKLGPNIFLKEKYVLLYENLQLYLRLGLKLKNASCIRIQSIAVATSTRSI